MGALPVKKLTKARQKSRMAHRHLKTLHLSRCPQCQNVKRSHRACPHCGSYNGRQVITPSSEKRE